MELALILFAASLAATAIAAILQAHLGNDEVRSSASVETLQPRRHEPARREDLKKAA